MYVRKPYVNHFDLIFLYISTQKQSYNHQLFHFSLFVGRTTKQEEIRITHQHTLLLNHPTPTKLCPLPAPHPPKKYPLPKLYQLYGTPFCVSACHWSNIPLVLNEIFSLWTYLVIPLIFRLPTPVIPPPWCAYMLNGKLQIWWLQRRGHWLMDTSSYVVAAAVSVASLLFFILMASLISTLIAS